MTKLNRACPASTSVDRRNCHEFGSVERFFNFLIPINLIHTFMITGGRRNIGGIACPLTPQKQTYAVQYAMSALGQKRTWCSIRSPRRRLRAPQAAPPCRALAPFDG